MLMKCIDLSIYIEKQILLTQWYPYLNTDKKNYSIVRFQMQV